MSCDKRYLCAISWVSRQLFCDITSADLSLVRCSLAITAPENMSPKLQPTSNSLIAEFSELQTRRISCFLCGSVAAIDPAGSDVLTRFATCKIV